MITAIASIILILQLLAFPFSFVMEGHINTFGNDGFIKVKLFSVIRIFYKQAFIKKIDAIHNDLVLKGRKKENFYHINANKDDKKSISRFLKIKFIPLVIIKRLDLHVEIGKNNDALITTIAVSAIRTIVLCLLVKLKSLHELEVSDEFIAEYNKDVLTIKFSCIIKVTIANIIFSYVLYLIKQSKKRRRKVDNRS